MVPLVLNPGLWEWRVLNCLAQGFAYRLYATPKRLSLGAVKQNQVP